MIASSAFFVLDGILGWPAAIYDGSWSQWGQLSADAAKGGQLKAESFWRTDIPSRSGLVAYNYTFIDVASFYGTGVNNLTTGVTTTITTPRYYKVVIDGTGTTFKWSKDNGVNWDATDVAIDPGVAQLLTEGAIVTFATGTGHTVGDTWTFTAGPRQPVEILSADGNACTGTLNLDGTKTFTPAGCTPSAPGSFDDSGNKIEEEDAQYMGSGGGSSGGGGGGSTGC